MTLQYLSRNALDVTRWDGCVAADPAGLPYGKSWWLDAATNGRWDGVVVDDYRLVLPLPRGKALGRCTQVQRPAFTQQCGPFGALRSGDLEAILQALPGRYLSFHLPLSERVGAPALPAGYAARTRTNYVLDLSPEYAALHQGFHKVLRRKLRRNGPARLSPADPETIIKLYRASVGKKAGLQEKHYRTIRRLIQAAQAHDAGICCRLDDDSSGFLAAGFFPWHQGRLINTFAASTPAGYANEGMARMIVELIKAHQGPGHLLDFEGSDLPGVAEFFRSFGPECREYAAVEKTGLAAWLAKA